MLLVLPVSKSDKDLAENAVKAFGLFPPGGGHSLLVVGSPNVTSELNDLASSLSKYFNETITHIFDTDCYLGWPTACNTYFLNTCYYMVGHNVPWLWYELDATPIKKNWLTAIEQEYNQNPVGFMGCIERAYVGFNGVLLEEDDAGKQMAACGVYPGDITGTVVPLRGVADTDRVWYQHIRWYVSPYARHTNLIANNYKTENYQIEGGEIACDSCNNTAWGNHYNNPIREEAVICHGCKDGTLMEVLTAPKALDCAGAAIPPTLYNPETGKTKPVPKSYRKRKRSVRSLAE